MTDITQDRPCLRPVDIFPIKAESGVGFVLHDRREIARNSIALSAGAALVLQQLDGTLTLREIQANILRATGKIIPYEQIETLVAKLDEELYLESPRYLAEYTRIRSEFLAMKSRPAALAGSAYPDDPVALRAFLDDLFAASGLPERSERNGTGLAAIVAPHIDLRRGGSAFARAYRALVEHSDADVFVILGIAHDGDGSPFTLTAMDFETPLGTVPTDREMVARIAGAAPADSLGDEMAHRREHSIEFQALLLRYLFPERDIAIVPILCGSLHEALLADGMPADDPAIGGFIGALREAMAASKRKVAIIAGVDLAHVGPRFGDERAADPATLRWVEMEDRGLLEAVAAGDANGVFSSIRKDLDRRHVCGYPALYTMLALLDGEAKGTLLAYEQSPEPETESAVTFAAMSFA